MRYAKLGRQPAAPLQWTSASAAGDDDTYCVRALLCHLASTKAAACLGAAAVACGAGGAATAVHRPVPHHPVVDHRPAPPQQPCPESTTPTAGTGNITVTVPRLVEVRLDAAGNPTAMRTNTGQQPCPGDTFVFESDQGVATDGPVTYVLTHAPRGEWTPGTWRPVTSAGRSAPDSRD